MKENKLIAEFMDLETPDGCYFEYITKEGEKSKPTHFILLEYHLSWDWLMPVVKKIEDMGCEVVMTNAECTISGNDCYVESIGKSRKGATYKAVVEFINQYNKNK